MKNIQRKLSCVFALFFIVLLSSTVFAEENAGLLRSSNTYFYQMVDPSNPIVQNSKSGYEYYIYSVKREEGSKVNEDQMNQCTLFFLIMQPISAIINSNSVILFILQEIIYLSKKLKLLWLCPICHDPIYGKKRRNACP